MLEYKLQKEKTVVSRSLLSNLLILALSAGLIFWSTRLIREKFTTVTSIDAVINGALTDIKAPQEGVIADLGLKTGEMIGRDRTLLTLKNDRVAKLQVQEINSRIKQQQAQLSQAQVQLARQQSLLQVLQADRENQQRLEVLEVQNSIQEVASELQKAKSGYQLAQIQHKRFAFLKAQGAVSQAILDTARTEMEQKKAEINSLEARINVLRTNQQAAKLGLTLSKTRSNSDPRIRLEEMQTEISNQRQTIQTLKQNIANTQAELAQANADLKLKQAVVVNAPISGVVWRLDAQEGKVVQQGESLGQILDCNKRWVDVFVDERTVKSIQPGTPATIELYGSSSPILQGQVSMVRSGLGRLTAGGDIAVPIPPNAPRNTQVRVELNSDTESGNPGFFCYVGYTGKVTFQIK